jgi:hypothetical protein
VLMQMLEVIVNIVRSGVGAVVSDWHLWRMVQTCARMCQEEGRSELLHQTAANSLTHVTLTVFSRVPELVTDEALAQAAAYLQSEHVLLAEHIGEYIDNENDIGFDKYRDGDGHDSHDGTAAAAAAAGLSTTKKRTGALFSSSDSMRSALFLDSVSTSLASDGVPVGMGEQALDKAKATRSRSSSAALSAGRRDDGINNNDNDDDIENEVDDCGPPYGVPSLVKILDFLSKLTNPAKHNTTTRCMALQLLNVVLETGGEGLSRECDSNNGTSTSPILDILKGDLCKFLLQNSQDTDLMVLSLTLRVVFNLFAAMKTHLKVQLEVFLTSVHLRIAESPSASSEQKELALESLVDFCREPALVLDLYSNYDCDVRCTNLFETLCKCLCKCATPTPLGGSSTLTLTALHLLAHEGVLAVVEAIARRCFASTSSVITGDGSAGSCDQVACGSSEAVIGSTKNRVEIDDNDDDESENTCSSTNDDKANLAWLESAHVKTASILRERKAMKKLLMQSAKQFNRKPLGKYWQEHAQDLGVLPKPASALDVATFLRNTPGLDKVAVGEYLSESPESRPFCALVLTEYIRTFQFRSMRIDHALRALLECFRLPGEAQKVDRIMEAFGQRLYEQNKDLPPTEDKPMAQPKTPLPVSAAAAAGQQARSDHDDEEEEEDSNYTAAVAAATGTNASGSASVNMRAVVPLVSTPPPALVKRSSSQFSGRSGKGSPWSAAGESSGGSGGETGDHNNADETTATITYNGVDDSGSSAVYGVYRSPSAAFILAFSIIMLHTDLHNASIPVEKKMTKEQFVRNNRGINDEEDFPRSLLEGVYDAIKKDQIRMLYDPHAHPAGISLLAESANGNACGPAVSLASDTGATWYVVELASLPAQMGCTRYTHSQSKRLRIRIDMFVVW